MKGKSRGGVYKPLSVLLAQNIVINRDFLKRQVFI